jgi:hypothetical protein
MTGEKPICSLSLDLDNQWSYMKTHGDAGWESFPSYLDIVVPRFLEILDDFSWKITVFVVGQDAALEKNHDALRMIVEAGHEVGNHSFNHEPWLHLFSEQQIEEEISRAEETIEGATGETPRGFRGPGFSLSPATLNVLARREYRYDGTTFPTYLGPLARAYYFLSSDFNKQERKKRQALFGRLRDGLSPLRPFVWQLQGKEILEIPVTTTPIFKTPFHFSYILYFATFSRILAETYFSAALRLCRLSSTQPSLLLHPLDFLGGDEVPDLSFFPAMKIDGNPKRKMLVRLLSIVSSNHSVLPMSAHADAALASHSLSRRSPDHLSR